jgi:hypothetical protein
MVQMSRFKFKDLEVRVQVVGFRAQDLGFRV